MKKFLLALVLTFGILGTAHAAGPYHSEGSCIINPNGHNFLWSDVNVKKQPIKYCVDLQEGIPIGDGRTIRSVGGENGIDLFMSYVSLFYRFGAIAIGLVCVAVIVFSGIQIIVGGANPEGVTTAKTRIMQAILSMILLFSSVMILRTINPNFFH
ncbi:hypothetical protein HN954_00485 [bacterium]|jgi:hypothetical protein|nr:hypothetical protein [bacterium]MBT6831596.1 hypothetical protein [bacterium]MBT6995891.1 hypothetical protein [bacterium]MBT7772665.1 hypothetical protein [bacterium]